MTTTILDAVDGARLVITDGFLHCMGVWHGGHTVNFYAVVPSDGDARPTTSISIGDFETGEVSVDEAREAIKQQFADERDALGFAE